jgi:hypothetical protein
MGTGNKRGTSFALSAEALRLLERLSKSMGIGKASVIEVALRLLSRSEVAGVEPPKSRSRRPKGGAVH